MLQFCLSVDDPSGPQVDFGQRFVGGFGQIEQIKSCVGPNWEHYTTTPAAYYQWRLNQQLNHNSAQFSRCPHVTQKTTTTDKTDNNV
jgi:hypothetical protein